MPKIVVFGGNGFIGCQVCRAALALGLDVTSVNRSGSPPDQADWVQKVSWVTADLSKDLEEMNPEVVKELRTAIGVVSCVGAFGSNKAMIHINGVTNVNAVKIAKEAGVKRFTYISTGRSTMPAFILRGYFEGKIMAEDAVAEVFREHGTILRPGFVFGTRKTIFGSLPLQVIGRPLKLFLELTKLNKLRNWPWMSMALTLPVHVESVGFAAAASAGGIFDDTDWCKRLSTQAGYKYGNTSAIVLESEDVDKIGNLIHRLHKEGGGLLKIE